MNRNQKPKPNPADPLKPGIALLVKLGSLAVHIDEFLSPHGHAFDRTAIETALLDAELKEWIAAMTKMAFVPEKRNK